jgi:hypothetical protein
VARCPAAHYMLNPCKGNPPYSEFPSIQYIDRTSGWHQQLQPCGQGWTLWPNLVFITAVQVSLLSFSNNVDGPAASECACGMAKGSPTYIMPTCWLHADSPKMEVVVILLLLLLFATTAAQLSASVCWPRSTAVGSSHTRSPLKQLQAT